MLGKLLASAPLLASAGQMLRVAPRPENATAESTFQQLLEADLSDLPFEVVDVAALRDNSSAAVSLSNHTGSTPVRRARKPLLWVHIHKAAGSFMCWMAVAKAGESVVKPSANCNWRPHDVYVSTGSASGAPSCLARQYTFSRGRYTYGQIERELYPSDLSCGSYFNYGVFLREPIDLIHSTLNYNQRYWGGKGKAVMSTLRQRMSDPNPLPCYLGQRPEWKTLDNFQTRLLADAFHVPAGRLTKQHLDRARARLSAFQVVARVEDLPSRGADMFEALGWPRYLARHIRAKKNSMGFDSLHFTQKEAKWLREVNHLDIQLYNELAGWQYKAAS